VKGLDFLQLDFDRQSSRTGFAISTVTVILLQYVYPYKKNRIVDDRSNDRKNLSDFGTVNEVHNPIESYRFRSCRLKETIE
jgi:hypothetical protein